MQRDNEIESNAPDWSEETPSDEILAQQLRETLSDSSHPVTARGWNERDKAREMLDRLESLGFTNKKKGESNE